MGGSEWGILSPPNCELRSLVQIRSLYSVGWTRISRANSHNRASLRTAITHPNTSRREEACITPMPPSPARSSYSYRAAVHAVPSAQLSPRLEGRPAELQSLMRHPDADFCF